MLKNYIVLFFLSLNETLYYYYSYYHTLLSLFSVKLFMEKKNRNKEEAAQKLTSTELPVCELISKIICRMKRKKGSFF